MEFKNNNRKMLHLMTAMSVFEFIGYSPVLFGGKKTRPDGGSSSRRGCSLYYFMGITRMSKINCVPESQVD